MFVATTRSRIVAVLVGRPPNPAGSAAVVLPELPSEIHPQRPLIVGLRESLGSRDPIREPYIAIANPPVSVSGIRRM